MSFVTPPAHEIVTATIPEEIQQCLHVRIEVFVNEQRFSLNDEIDQYVPSVRFKSTSADLVTYVLIAIMFLYRLHAAFQIRLRSNRDPYPPSPYPFPHPDRYYSWEQPYRQYKFGRALVDALHNYIKTDAKRHVGSDASTVKVIAHSQIPVKGFYAKFGYIPKVSAQA
uniref:Uncharacterized protein n=1 Tax=Moniliophthora roreri TaxID=221103 RepID=A0A0W0GAN5_MONRR